MTKRRLVQENRMTEGRKEKKRLKIGIKKFRVMVMFIISIMVIDSNCTC